MFDLNAVKSFAVTSLYTAILGGQMEVPTTNDIKKFVAEGDHETISQCILGSLNDNFGELILASASSFRTIEYYMHINIAGGHR